MITIISFIWLTGSLLLLSAALDAYDRVGEKLADDTSVMFIIIAAFWPILASLFIGMNVIHSIKAWKLLRKSQEYNEEK